MNKYPARAVRAAIPVRHVRSHDKSRARKAKKAENRRCGDRLQINLRRCRRFHRFISTQSHCCISHFPLLSSLKKSMALAFEKEIPSGIYAECPLSISIVLRYNCSFVPASANIGAWPIYMFFGQCFVASSESPVSSKLFKLERIAGQPVETEVINFESVLSISWVMVSFTVSPCGSSSMVQRE